MKSFFAVLFVTTLCSFGAQAQDQRNPKTSEVKNISDSSPKLSNGTTFQVELTDSLDSRRAKAGDTVKAKLKREIAQGPALVPKGSKVIGHISYVQPYTKQGGGASLGIIFDKFVLKNGSEFPFQAVIVSYNLPPEILDRSAPSTRRSVPDPITGYDPSPRVTERGKPDGIYLSGPTFNSSAGEVKLHGGTVLGLKIAPNAPKQE